MKKFYAIYDIKDNLVKCGFAAELGYSPNSLWRMAQNRTRKFGLRAFEIPLTPQKDIFEEEDKLFLESEKENAYTNRELAQMQGISERQFYTRLKNKKEKK